jgi:hypothetical protein
MKINIKGIIGGLYNSIFIKEEVEKVAKERLNICDHCEYNSENAKLRGYKTIRPDVYCTDCSCNLKLKTRYLSESCPREKWMAVASDEEDEKIQNLIKD